MNLLAEVPGDLPLQLEGDPTGHAGHVVLVVQEGGDVAHVAGDGCVPQHVTLAPETEEGDGVVESGGEDQELLLDVLLGAFEGWLIFDLICNVFRI